MTVGKAGTMAVGCIPMNSDKLSKEEPNHSGWVLLTGHGGTALDLSSVDGLIAQLLFNTKQLVVLTYTVSTGKRASLDLAGIGGD